MAKAILEERLTDLDLSCNPVHLPATLDISQLTADDQGAHVAFGNHFPSCNDLIKIAQSLKSFIEANTDDPLRLGSSKDGIRIYSCKSPINRVLYQVELGSRNGSHGTADITRGENCTYPSTVLESWATAVKRCTPYVDTSVVVAVPSIRIPAAEPVRYGPLSPESIMRLATLSLEELNALVPYIDIKTLDLPVDVRLAVQRGMRAPQKGSRARGHPFAEGRTHQVIDTVLTDIAQALNGYIKPAPESATPTSRANAIITGLASYCSDHGNLFAHFSDKYEGAGRYDRIAAGLVIVAAMGKELKTLYVGKTRK